MSQAFQAFQEFFAKLWHRWNSEWLPELVANLILYWQWLSANPIITLCLAAVLLLWACLVIRKATHEGWNIGRSLLIFVLFAFGFAGVLAVLHVV
jgi:hypothetical protein